MKKNVKLKVSVIMLVIIVAGCSLLGITTYAHKYEVATEREMKSTLPQNIKADGIDYGTESIYIDPDSIK